MKINLTEINIREAAAEDFEHVLQLLKQLWPERELIEDPLKVSFLKGIELKNPIILCAISSGIIIGIGTLTIRNSLYAHGNLAHIDELIVDHSHRGKGIGNLLLDELIKIAKERSCTLIELDSALHREQAHRFYEKVGFWKSGYVLTKVLFQKN